MDQHLEMDTTFTLLVTLQQAQVHTQTLEQSTVHQLATVIHPLSPSHSWRVVTTFNLTKWKSSMKLPKEVEEFGVSALHEGLDGVQCLVLLARFFKC